MTTKQNTQNTSYLPLIISPLLLIFIYAQIIFFKDDKYESSGQISIFKITRQILPKIITKSIPSFKTKNRSQSKLETNKDRIAQIKKTCQKMRESNTPEIVEYFRKADEGLKATNRITERFGAYMFISTQLQERILEKYSKSKNFQENYDKYMKKYYLPNKHLFCLPPKAGTTSWQTSLIYIRKQNLEAIKNFEMASNKTLAEIYESDNGKNGKYRKMFKYADPEEIPFHGEHKDHQAQGMFKTLDKLSNKELFHNRTKYLFGDDDDFNHEKRYRILNVRHPVERLYSAWHQKFNKNHWNVNTYRHDFLREDYIPNFQETETHIVRFDQFVDYFLRTKELNPFIYEENLEIDLNKYNGKPEAVPGFIMKKARIQKENYFINHHWHSLLWNCLPCHVDYDYVTQLETAHDDSVKIFDKIFNTLDRTHVFFYMF